MKEIIGIWTMLWLDVRKSLLIFWSILIGVVVVLWGVAASMGDNGNMNMNLNTALVIYIAILGAQFFRTNLYYGVSFGATRQQVYVGTISFVFLFALLNGVINNIVYFGFREAFSRSPLAINMGNLYELTSFPQTFLSYLGLDLILVLLVVTLFMLFSIVKNQIGPLALYVLAGVFALTVFLPQFNSVWASLGRWVVDASYIGLTGTGLLVVVVLLMVPAAFIRKFKVVRTEG
ncbi:MAG: hypothetical protein LRY73_08720 [Bacillus sp. (in: Bacteria)]|nr:hypothetical protein [Bacillus sp. (in: firmicutes)]